MIKAQRRQSFDDIKGVPGAFLMLAMNVNGTLTDDQGIFYCCPCGCGDFASVRFTPKEHSWNGEYDTPTIAPVIKRVSGCMWAGHLTDGVWRRA